MTDSEFLRATSAQTKILEKACDELKNALLGNVSLIKRIGDGESGLIINSVLDALKDAGVYTGTVHYYIKGGDQ